MFVVFLTLSSFFITQRAQAGLPIDWSGTLGFDTIRIENYRRTNQQTTTYSENSNVIDGTAQTAKFQSYVFRLNPKIIVNDSATVKGEFSVGNDRGGLLGQSGTTNGAFAKNGFFHYSRPSSTSALSVNQAYMELYTESAIYKVGRMSKSWGLGVLFDDGSDTWDRFITAQDGLQIDYRFGNLRFSPSWSKIDTGKLTSASEVKELGVSLAYENNNSQLESGIYYGTRTAGGGNTFYQVYQPGSAPAYTVNSIGSVKATFFDFYLKKKWNKFQIGAEVPVISGEIANPYGLATAPATAQDYKASAYIIESSYQVTPSVKLGLNAGKVSGADGGNSFGAMYLNPNYHVANLMFRYNMLAVEDTGGNGNLSQDIFESSVTNATFAKIYLDYTSENWTWKSALIKAQAVEVASQGSTYFIHEKGHRSATTATADQDKDMGMELDFGFDYKWNPNIVLGSFLGYHFVGDYFAFDGSANKAPVKNSYIVGMNLGLQF